jgi:hypothetical protein
VIAIQDALPTPGTLPSSGLYARHLDVAQAVTVEVAGPDVDRLRDPARERRVRVVHSDLERAVAVAEEEGEREIVIGGDQREVALAVAVEVARRDAVRHVRSARATVVGRKGYGRVAPGEPAHAIVLESDEEVRVVVGERQIGRAVAVEIGHRERNGSGPRVVVADGVIRRLGALAGAVAEEHEEQPAVGPRIARRDRDVGVAVLVEVGSDQAAPARGLGERRGRRGRGELPGAVVQHDVNVPALFADEDGVGRAVPVHVDREKASWGDGCNAGVELRGAGEVREVTAARVRERVELALLADAEDVGLTVLVDVADSDEGEPLVQSLTETLERLERAVPLAERHAWTVVDDVELAVTVHVDHDGDSAGRVAVDVHPRGNGDPRRRARVGGCGCAGAGAARPARSSIGARRAAGDGARSGTARRRAARQSETTRAEERHDNRTLIHLAPFDRENGMARGGPSFDQHCLTVHDRRAGRPQAPERMATPSPPGGPPRRDGASEQTVEGLGDGVRKRAGVMQLSAS